MEITIFNWPKWEMIGFSIVIGTYPKLSNRLVQLIHEIVAFTSIIKLRRYLMCCCENASVINSSSCTHLLITLERFFSIITFKCVNCKYSCYFRN